MPKTAKAHAPYNHQLGRLSALGPKEVWQTALYLPSHWDDLRVATTVFAQLPNTRNILCRGRLDGGIEIRYNEKNIPRMIGYLTDGITRLGFMAFGDTREMQAAIQQNPDDVILYGEKLSLDNHVFLKSVQVIPAKWVGRLRPHYPGKSRVISPETVRQRMIPLLGAAIPIARSWLLKTLNTSELRLLEIAECTNQNWSVEEILKRSHLPRTVDEGFKAQSAIERIAAFGVIQQSLQHLLTGQCSAPAFNCDNWLELAKGIPFHLVDEQMVAISEILAQLNNGSPMRHCLSGDVGTGKTAVYAIVAASIHLAGGRVGIMLPNEQLAIQTAKDIQSWWPNIKTTFISGSVDCPADLGNEGFFIGTQALLFKAIGHLDLVVVDEQQKFSRAQREGLLEKNSHLLEVSATCIPRSQALIRFGALSMSKLRDGHVQKEIFTRIWKSDVRKELMVEIRKTISEGGKIIVVYPKRSDHEDSSTPLPSAEDAFEQWDRICPGYVRLAHGGLDEEQNQSAIRAMKEGTAGILVTTSLVEVGINIPNTRRVVVVHAERFGLSSLHQFRGRVAREGGIGHCDLVLPCPVKEEVEYRLDVLTKTNDGFAVAEHDMKIRGFGNLAVDSDKQSGSDDTFLFGRPLNPSTLDSVLAALSI